MDDDDGIVSWPAGRPFPNAIEFQHQVQGSLKFRFEIFGDDLWVKDNIDAYVRYTHPRHIPGTIDAQEWVENAFWTHIGTFSRDVSMSTNMVPSRIFKRLTLSVLYQNASIKRHVALSISLEIN